MSLLNKIKEMKEEEEIAKIKLEENKTYEGDIVDASFAKSDKGLQQVKLTIKVTGPEAIGKQAKVTYTVDKNTPNKVQGEIGWKQAVTLFYDLGVNCDVDLEVPLAEEKFFALACIEVKGKPVKLTVRYVKDKTDPAKIFNNYSIKASSPRVIKV